MKIHQMDVTAAFLNGGFEEEIYMKQSEGYAESGKENLVCLKKRLYGLKQCPKRIQRAYSFHCGSIRLF